MHGPGRRRILATNQVFVWGLLAVIAAMASGQATRAQPVAVFERSVNEELILRWAAGPDALSAIDTILAEMNWAVGQPGRFERFPAQTTILVSCSQKRMRRDGGVLYSGRSNAVRVDAFIWDTIQNETVIVDLADPLEDNPNDPTLAVMATIKRKIELGSLKSGDNDETKVVCQARAADGTAVDIAFEYESDDVLFRGSQVFQATGEEALHPFVVNRFRSAPSRRFQLVVDDDFDLFLFGADFAVRVVHPDPLVERIFNDPQNQRLVGFNVLLRVKVLEGEE